MFFISLKFKVSIARVELFMQQVTKKDKNKRMPFLTTDDMKTTI